MAASVVLPNPGGPASSRWSAAWPRRRAASRMTDRCSFTSVWPTNSSSRWGRRPASMLSSSEPMAGSRNSSRTPHRQDLEGVAQQGRGVRAAGELAQGVADLLGGVAEPGQRLGHRLGGGGGAIAVDARHQGEGGHVAVKHHPAQLPGPVGAEDGEGESGTDAMGTEERLEADPLLPAGEAVERL